MQHKRRLGSCFWRLWAAVGISSVGDGMVLVALPLLALRYTSNPVAISGVMVSGRLPALAAALPVGALADRINRRTMILAIEVMRFVVLAALGAVLAVGEGTLALLYVAALLLGAFDIAFDVVCGACLPSMVKHDRLVTANSHLMNAEQTSANLVGPALGGMALAVSRALPFLADAVGFAASAVLLRKAIPDNQPAPTEMSGWGSLTHGLRWYLGHPVLRLTAAMVATYAFAQAMVLGVLALYARDRLHLSSGGYGILLAVASLGVLLGSAIAPRLHDRLGAGPTITLMGLLVALLYPVLAVTGSVLVAGAALLAQDALVLTGNVASQSLRQRLVPAQMQGRATSAYLTIVLSAVPLGALAGGLLVGGMGLRTTFFLAAAVQLGVVAVAGPRLMARLRTVATPAGAPARPVVVDVRDRVTEAGSRPGGPLPSEGQTPQPVPAQP